MHFAYFEERNDGARARAQNRALVRAMYTRYHIRALDMIADCACEQSYIIYKIPALSSRALGL